MDDRKFIFEYGEFNRRSEINEGYCEQKWILFNPGIRKDKIIPSKNTDFLFFYVL